MAVYTDLTDEDLASLLAAYDLGAAWAAINIITEVYQGNFRTWPILNILRNQPVKSVEMTDAAVYVAYRVNALTLGKRGRSGTQCNHGGFSESGSCKTAQLMVSDCRAIWRFTWGGIRSHFL